MRRSVLVVAVAMLPHCLFPDVSALGGGPMKDAGADSGGDVTAPVPPTQVDRGLGYVSTFAVDATSIYFMSSSLGGFFSADKTNGGNRNMISSDVEYALKLDANNFYWSSLTAVVQRAQSAGTNITDVMGSITSYTLDSANVYAVVGGNPGSIVSVPIGSGSPKTLGTYAYPGDSAVDGSFVYFTSANAIVKLPIAGGNPNTVATGPNDAAHVLIAGNTIFWTDLGVGTYPEFPNMHIESVDKSGAPSTQMELTGSEYTITSIVADTSSLYWSIDGPPSMDDAGNATHPAGEVHRVPLTGGATTVLATGQGAPNFVCVDDAYVYWVNQDEGTVYRVPK